MNDGTLTNRADIVRFLQDLTPDVFDTRMTGLKLIVLDNPKNAIQNGRSDVILEYEIDVFRQESIGLMIQIVLATTRNAKVLLHRFNYR